MPRALTLLRTEVGEEQRARFLGRLRSRRDHYGKAGCRYWVFEEVAREGSFIEFIEGADAAIVAAALAGAPESITGARIYQEREID